MSNPEIPLLLQILQEACKKFGYKWELTDTYSNNLVKVSKNNKSFYSSNGKIGAYPLNPRFAAQLVNDKGWTYKILQKNGFKIPQGDYFFIKDQYRELRGDGKELEDAINYAEQLGYPVFVKPNNSSLGILAEVVYSKEQLQKHLQDISEIARIALLQEVIEAPEYRIFVLDGEIQFAYQRRRTKITGDNKSTIAQLIQKLNKSIKRERNKIKLDSHFLLKQLDKYKLNMDSIPKKGQQLNITSKTNISSGGEITGYTEKISKETKKWARKLTKIFNLRVCGIDVFVKDSINNPDSFTVIELNQNPNLAGIYEFGHRKKALDIWKKILEKYFL